MEIALLGISYGYNQYLHLIIVAPVDTNTDRSTLTQEVYRSISCCEYKLSQTLNCYKYGGKFFWGGKEDIMFPLSMRQIATPEAETRDRSPEQPNGTVLPSMQDTGDQLPALCSHLSYCQLTVTAHWYLFQLWWAPRQQYVPWSESRKPQSVVSHHHHCSLVCLHALTYLHASGRANQKTVYFSSLSPHIFCLVSTSRNLCEAAGFTSEFTSKSLRFAFRTTGLMIGTWWTNQRGESSYKRDFSCDEEEDEEERMSTKAATVEISVDAAIARLLLNVDNVSSRRSAKNATKGFLSIKKCTFKHYVKCFDEPFGMPLTIPFHVCFLEGPHFILLAVYQTDRWNAS